MTGTTTTTATATHCPYCALQCATTLTPQRGRVPVTVTPRDFPTNRGGLCRKGWTAPEVLAAPDRLTTPLLRDGAGRLVPASWDDALARVADGVRAAQAGHGRDAVAVLGGGGLTNEQAYLLGKLARVVLRTSRIDYNGRFCMSSAAAASTRAFGLDRGLPFPLEDLAGADAVLLVGSNPAATMPPAVQHLARARRRGGLVVVDPRRTATAELAALHLQPTPGTDLALVLGLLHVVVHDRLVDEPYVAARTTGWDAVRRAATAWWPARVERTTSVPEADLRRAAHLLADGARGAGAYVLTGRGAEQHAKGTDTVTACIDLALALGLPGRPGSGYGCITGQGNGQGGREHGQKADQLPGYRRLDDPAARAHVAGVWGVDPADLPGPGVSAQELLAAVGTPAGPRVLLVHGTNPVVSAPATTGLAERLQRLDLLVVADVVPSETAQLADVVLPVAQWAEEDGTMTTLEGRVVLRRRAVDPPAQVRTELEVLAGLAAALGSTAAFPTDAGEALAELGRASAGGPADYSGVTRDRLERGEALHWPCPATPDGAPDSPGTPRLFLDAFATPDGRARFLPVDHRPVADDLRDDAPVYLVTGRLLEHYQSGAQTRRVPELLAAAPRPLLELHPDLAGRLGVEDGAPVVVTSRRGRVRARALLTESVRPDTVFLPFHFGGDGAANLVTSDALDPVSRMPEFKVCAVDVQLDDRLDEQVPA